MVEAPDVLLFKVTKPLAGKDTSSLPDELIPFEPLDPEKAERERIQTCASA
jgi:spore coat protein A